jgi:hydrogenase/urease accessory protein HupE
MAFNLIGRSSAFDVSAILTTSARLYRAAPALVLAAVAVLVCANRAVAHPEGFSGLKVDLEPGQVRASLTVHTRDMGNWFPPRAYPNYVEDVCRAMERMGGELLDVRVNDERVAPSSVKAWLQETGLIRVDLTYPYPTESAAQWLWVASPQIRKLPRGHTQLLLVEDRRQISPGQEAGPTLLQDDLDAERIGAEVEVPPLPGAAPATRPTSRRADPTRPARSAGGSRTNFFVLGVGHIMGGYDHLLFVAALLLACRTLREAATIITFFTVAHSITLTLAALDVVRLRGGIVEPAIAATIVFVAVENLVYRPRLGWRCAITFFFGLIHGLGFAGDLREMLPGSTFGQVVSPLLKFSAGVEVGHLALVALALPLLLLMKHKAPRVDRYLSPGLSGVIAVIGACWLVGRVWAEVRGMG